MHLADDNIKEKIINFAFELGFSLCGFSKNEILEKEKKDFSAWIENKKHAEMKFLEQNIEVRANPNLLLLNAKTIISLAINYFPGNYDWSKSYYISKYALGQDYHEVVKNKLNLILKFIKELCPKADGRAFVDSAPIFEKVWAQKSGLGWIGKNTLLINKEYGSYLFLGEIIVDIEIEPDEKSENHCGSCNKCAIACPTGALNENQLDANKCISYLTIENKNEIPINFKKTIGDKIFGCDECQNVCPWNENAKVTSSKDFLARGSIINMTKKDWDDLDNNKFAEISFNSVLKRTKFKGLKRNIDYVK